MNYKKINLGMNCELEVLDTDFAKSFDILNNETKYKIKLGDKLKRR